jgi:acyl-CoA-binding protein
MALPKGFVLEEKSGLPAGFVIDQGNIITSDVPTVVGSVPNPPVVQEPPRTMMDRVKAVYEVPAAIVTGAAAPFLGVGAGAIENIRQGTNKRVDSPEFAQRFQYQPTSPVSQDILQSMGNVLEASKLPPVIPSVGMLPSYQRSLSGTPTQVRQAAQTVQETGPKIAQALRQVAPPPAPVSTMAGAGAAEVPNAVVRAQMAEQLRVPIKLSKGQATRDLGQQQFEVETMKTYPEDVGRPLIAAQELRNTQIGQNLDAYVDATGAKVANPFYFRPTGEVVDAALRESANKAKNAYKSAYTTARASEEGQQKVNVQGIINQLDTMEAEATNAPVINAAKIKLNQLAKNGEMTLNEVEEVRKMVNRLSGDTPSNMAFGGDIKTMIDTATQNAGGDLFKEARRLRTKFANEFENIGLIDDLLSKKPNSNDRVVALEKVFDKSVMQADLDSLKSLGYTLKKTEKGQQAWAELKGQTIENLRNAITSNIETDSLGQRTFNPKQFDVIVKNLDKSGKLDYLLGKAGAQEIRNLRDTVIAINSPVKGINTSNTSSAVDKVLNKLLQKIPLAGPMVEVGSEALEKKKLTKQVQEAINFTPEKLADELRKGKK